MRFSPSERGTAFISPSKGGVAIGSENVAFGSVRVSEGGMAYGLQFQ